MAEIKMDTSVSAICEKKNKQTNNQNFGEEFKRTPCMEEMFSRIKNTHTEHMGAKKKSGRRPKPQLTLTMAAYTSPLLPASLHNKISSFIPKS